MPQVKYGSTVQVHYNAQLRNGEFVESTAGGEPLRVTVGAGKVMRGFEEALVGMGPGESKRVVVPPEKAFGRRKPESSSRHRYETTTPVGERPGTFQHQVVNRGTADEFCIIVSDRGLKLDNSPHLAGEELIFDVDVVEIEH